MADGKSAPPPRGAEKRSTAEQDAVKVEAVRTTRGQPATSVTVEVGTEALAGRLGRLEGTPQVTARVPAVEGEGIAWREEPVPKMDERPREDGGRAIRYGTTYYGPADPERHGVGIDIKAEHRVVRVSPGSGAVDVHEEDHPPHRR